MLINTPGLIKLRLLVRGNGESAAASCRSMTSRVLSKTMLNSSTVNFEDFYQEFWSVATKCNETDSFVCHSTLISCTVFLLLYITAEKLVCRGLNATGVLHGLAYRMPDLPHGALGCVPGNHGISN